MRDLFDEVDVDGNGVVTRAELSLPLGLLPVWTSCLDLPSLDIRTAGAQ